MRIAAESTPRNLPIRPDSGAIGPPAWPLAMAVIASRCSALARSSMRRPTDQLPFPISAGVYPSTTNGMPSSETLPKLPWSMCIAIANVHEPLLGRVAIWPRMQGQTKSQLQVSKYCPLIFQDGVAIAGALPPRRLYSRARAKEFRFELPDFPVGKGDIHFVALDGDDVAFAEFGHVHALAFAQDVRRALVVRCRQRAHRWRRCRRHFHGMGACVACPAAEVGIAFRILEVLEQRPPSAHRRLRVGDHPFELVLVRRLAGFERAQPLCRLRLAHACALEPRACAAEALGDKIAMPARGSSAQA